jgi:hypothetical protein
MALRSAEARKRNREQMKRLEDEVISELGDKPFTRLILAKLRKHPEVANEIIDAMFQKAAAGNVRAFNAIVDRTDGPVQKELEKNGPRVIVLMDWQVPSVGAPEDRPGPVSAEG